MNRPCIQMSLQTSLIAACLVAGTAQARSPGVSLTPQAFIEISWENVNASRYEVRAGSSRLMSASRLSYLHLSDVPPENLSVYAIRFEGDGDTEPFREVREPIDFMAETTERYVIDWDPQVYTRPFVGVRAAYAGPAQDRGTRIRAAQQRPFILPQRPAWIYQVVFGQGLAGEEGRYTAPFDAGPDGFNGLGPYTDLTPPDAGEARP
ncbi:hypothetical protein F1654_05385 [Alkalicaulis satelles]|uniref:Uncharacterized protein n=1 Tax=Alkalicaulis satelles TaxID=2609175 RepID=A0A5M6ZKP1_9PROT|nr:hypothetical protein [Alkalicaulis satelles]KAA5805412.1 hypothetical protein F1654_05385 [Alkalicaulis satelles]